MDVRDIVRKAWQITQVHIKKLIWYGFMPAFFGVIVSSVYLAYQYNAFKHSVLSASGPDTDYIGIAMMVWNLITSHPTLSVIAIILSVIVVLGYILTPPVFTGILINALMRIKRYESIEGSVEVGVRHFFPMFEFALLTGSFSIITLFTEAAFILRWWGESIFFVFLPILLFVAMAGLIINFLFTYSEYYIVLEDKSLIRSIMDSTVLVIANLRKTILIFVLMMLIGARVILNVLLVLLIPMLVVAASSYLAGIFLSTFGFIVIGIFGFAILIVSSYLLGLFHIFATAVWVLTFAELTRHSEPVKEEGDSPDSD
jgi:hypothetical protein